MDRPDCLRRSGNRQQPGRLPEPSAGGQRMDPGSGGPVVSSPVGMEKGQAVSLAYNRGSDR